MAVKELVIGWQGKPFVEIEEMKFKERYRLQFTVCCKLMFTTPC